ncbi:MAG: hypothetical protein Q3X43_08540, partial [Alistipes sp.]|uniref:YbjN domain-containing protein n=1 Tax=Alistipes sp. TaxID=1872444 RepID=UPI00284991A8
WKSFMKTFVDAPKDYDQLEIYRKWLRDNNISFQDNKEEGILLFRYQGLCFMITVPENDRNWLSLVLPNVHELVVKEKREYVLEVLNSINQDRKCVKAILVGNQVWLAIEMFIDSTPVIDDFFERLLMILIETRMILYSKMQ